MDLLANNSIFLRISILLYFSDFIFSNIILDISLELSDAFDSVKFLPLTITEKFNKINK